MRYDILMSPEAIDHLREFSAREHETDYEAWMLSENPEFMALIERSRQRYQREGGVPLNEVRRRLGLAA